MADVLAARSEIIYLNKSTVLPRINFSNKKIAFRSELNFKFHSKFQLRLWPPLHTYNAAGVS